MRKTMLFLQTILFVYIIIFINESKTDTIIDEVTTTQSTVDQAVNDIRKKENQLQKDQEQFKIDRFTLQVQKQSVNSIKNTDVIRLNVGGEIIITTRLTFTQVPKSLLSIMFNGRWEHKLEIDQNKNIYLDFDPHAFRYLLDQLRLFKTNNFEYISLPSDPSLVTPFKKMIHKLNLDLYLSPQKKNVITFNVNGQVITTQRKAYNDTSNSTFNTVVSSSKVIKFDNTSDIFVDYHPKIFKHLIDQLREKLFTNNIKSSLKPLTGNENIYFDKKLIDRHISRTKVVSRITNNTQWKQHGITVAGGNGRGDNLNQLGGPSGLSIDDDQQTMYIADWYNNRIVEWKFNTESGQIIAGGRGQGNQTNQLNYPTDVLVDTRNDSLIICDRGNRRIVEWSRQNGTKNGQILISNIHCWDITMDKNGSIYISDTEKNEVRRWKRGETNGILVAGGNGRGKHLNQLDFPTHIFVDQDDSVYISDNENHRVMKWMKNAKEGIIVAGGQGPEDQLAQLSYPNGVIVDHSGNVYVADHSNPRIMCWSKGSKQGRIIVGGNGAGEQSDQLTWPRGISFDREDNLYVVDYWNHRVQKFEIDKY